MEKSCKKVQKECIFGQKVVFLHGRSYKVQPRTEKHDAVEKPTLR